MASDEQAGGAEEGARTILLVEDSDDDARLAVRALKSCGIRLEVVRALDGHEALLMLGLEFGSRATPQFPHLIICDVKMPRVGGVEVLEKIRGDDRFNDLPIVMFSTSAHPLDVDRCMELGACDYCVKPLDAHEYAACVRDIVKRWLLPAGTEITPPCLLESAVES